MVGMTEHGSKMAILENVALEGLAYEEVIKRLPNKWYAPSLFITNYGSWGFKFEADCYKHDENGKVIEHDGFNVNSPTREQSKKNAGRPCKWMNTKWTGTGNAYQDGKKMFWAEWN